MAKVNEESIFPAPRENLWRVLKLYLDDEVIRRIHPFIISSKQVDKEVFERDQRVYGRTFSCPGDEDSFIEREAIRKSKSVSYVEGQLSLSLQASRLCLQFCGCKICRVGYQKWKTKRSYGSTGLMNISHINFADGRSLLDRKRLVNMIRHWW